MDGVRHSGIWLQHGGGRKWHFALGWIRRWRFGWRRPRNRISRLFVAHFLFANSGVAEVARLAALGTNDLRFDDEVVGTTDHQQMFNIVASNNNKLALPVEVEGIDGPKPRLPGPSVARQPEPSSEGKAENHGKQNHGSKECQCRDEKGETFVCEKTYT
jgi:hypothetical protein